MSTRVLFLNALLLAQRSGAHCSSWNRLVAGTNLILGILPPSIFNLPPILLRRVFSVTLPVLVVPKRWVLDVPPCETLTLSLPISRGKIHLHPCKQTHLTVSTRAFSPVKLTLKDHLGQVASHRRKSYKTLVYTTHRTAATMG